MLSILAPGLCCGFGFFGEGSSAVGLALGLYVGRGSQRWDVSSLGGGQDDELPQLAEFATEVTKRRMGVIRHLWPSIRGCLDAGHSVRAVLLFYGAMVGVMFVGVGSVAAFEITIASSNR